MGYLVVVRLEAKAGLYTAFQTIRAILSFLMILYLVFVREDGITAMITGLLLIDGVVLLILVLWNPVGLSLSFSRTMASGRKELIAYGMAGLVLNLSILSLSLSDRYVILAYEGLSPVGVYDQVYKISQLSVMALVTVFFNTINPELFQKLERNLSSAAKSMGQHMTWFVGLGLPLVVYLSLFSNEIADLLLGTDFREAKSIMPFVFFAAFFQGISNFWELRMKFSGRMRLLTLAFWPEPFSIC